MRIDMTRPERIHLQKKDLDFYSLRVEISSILSFQRMQESPCEQVVRRCLYSQA